MKDGPMWRFVRASMSILNYFPPIGDSSVFFHCILHSSQSMLIPLWMVGMLTMFLQMLCANSIILILLLR